jgi:hypothetical protein
MTDHIHPMMTNEQKAQVRVNNEVLEILSAKKSYMTTAQVYAKTQFAKSRNQCLTALNWLKKRGKLIAFREDERTVKWRAVA